VRDTPVLLKSPTDNGEKLQRIDIERNDERDEGWLQRLLFRHPGLLPVEVFDEVFAPLISVARELRVESGAIDNVYISPQGRLTLVETKLWKNPEKHRTVVAQVVDYAKDLAKWNLDEFLDAVAKTPALDGRTSFKDRVKPHVSDDWTAFEDKMLNNLRKGNFLLLIVGDRVSPNVALLSDAIHAAPGLGYTLGLVEMRMFTMSEAPWPLVVVPDVVGRTVEKTRGIVRVTYKQEQPCVSIDIKDDDEQTPSDRKLDAETLLSEIKPPSFSPIYRSAMQRWESIGGTLRFAPSNLFWDIEMAGEVHTPLRCNSDQVTVIKRARFEEWSSDAALYEEYLKNLKKSPTSLKMALANKHFVDHSTLTPADLQVIVDATIHLVERIRDAGVEVTAE
jgi:hypothetical protein